MSDDVWINPEGWMGRALKAEAEVERLRTQCEGLAQSAMNNGQELLLRERAMEEAADFLDEIATRADDATNSDDLNAIAADCRAWKKRLRGDK